MVNGSPDRVLFLERVRGLIESVSKFATAEHPRVSFFGEMVALLWAEAKVDAAIRLEQLWNELPETCNADLLCAYPAIFRILEHEHAFGRVCTEHSAVYSG